VDARSVWEETEKNSKGESQNNNFIPLLTFRFILHCFLYQKMNEYQDHFSGKIHKYYCVYIFFIGRCYSGKIHKYYHVYIFLSADVSKLVVMLVFRV